VRLEQKTDETREGGGRRTYGREQWGEGQGENERRVNRMIENRQRNQDISVEFLRRAALPPPLARLCFPRCFPFLPDPRAACLCVHIVNTPTSSTTFPDCCHQSAQTTQRACISSPFRLFVSPPGPLFIPAPGQAFSCITQAYPLSCGKNGTAPPASKVESSNAILPVACPSALTRRDGRDSNCPVKTSVNGLYS